MAKQNQQTISQQEMRERRWLFISIKKSAVPRICFWGQTVLSPPLMIQDVNKSTSYLQK
uniref:Uncharacterized protein n=1 Tax=Lotus japonicus TaxID=34305 RepID=I3SZ17_LOTJA|nr:unknown [Lotus japonicus]